jgi:DeoR/GlpR family transcriptional regulator of sugar metabolism
MAVSARRAERAGNRSGTSRQRSWTGHSVGHYARTVTDSPVLPETSLVAPVFASHSRRSDLLAMIRSNGRVEVADMPNLLGVSAETVRRDLRVLESQGMVRRGYGVAYPVESGAFESALAVRSNINPEEKLRIASALIPRIGEAQTIFLDEGYQTQLVAQRLPVDRPLTVVTASLPVATLLAPRSNVQVVMLGGRVRGNTLGVVDHWAADMLSKLTVDLAILGANGVSVERGLTTPDPAVAAVKTAAVQSAMRRIFIGAHHKFGTTTFVKFAECHDFELLLTGHELSPTLANRFTSAGCQLVRV